MVDYNLIKNEELKKLVMLSESIHSLQEVEIQQWIERIASLPTQGQAQIITALRDEQEQIQQAKLAKRVTPEMEKEKIEADNIQLIQIKHNFDTSVRQENERVSNEESNQAAEAILKNIS